MGGGKDEGWEQSGKGESEVSLAEWGSSWARESENEGSREGTKLGLQKGTKQERHLWV